MLSRILRPRRGAVLARCVTHRTSALSTNGGVRVQPAVEALERGPCLQCGQAKTTTLLESPACTVSGLRLTCSKTCAEKFEQTHSDLLLQYKSVVEDIRYGASEDAKRLFSEVLTVPKQDHASTAIASWQQYLQLYTSEQQWLFDPRAVRLVSAAYSYVMTLSHFLPGIIALE
uniref:Uncharacterized protein n=1 Tax=Globisporangium ultimum (strain ATCC 200006 / CBS 805.95 / DAOM BR144) TaxID=431595 RepID=K3WH96_GLOUD